MSEDDGRPADPPPPAPTPEAPDGPRSETGREGSSPSRLRLLQFSSKEEPSAEGIVTPGKSFTAADCIPPLKHALAGAQAGHLAAVALVGIYVDGSELFAVASNPTTFSEVIGALSVVKSQVVAAYLRDFEIKSKGI